MPKPSQNFIFFLFLCVLIVTGFFGYAAIYPQYVEYRLALLDIAKNREPSNITVIAAKLQSDPRMLQNLAVKLEEKHWNRLAIIVLHSAFFVNPKDKDTVIALTGLLWEEGKELEAMSVVETSLGQGLTLNDGLAEMYIGLCTTQAKYTKAIHLANLSAQTPGIKHWRAIAFTGAKEYQKASKELKQLLAVEPNNLKYRISYARNLISAANNMYVKPSATILASK